MGEPWIDVEVEQFSPQAGDCVATCSGPTDFCGKSRLKSESKFGLESCRRLESEVEFGRRGAASKSDKKRTALGAAACAMTRANLRKCAEVSAPRHAYVTELWQDVDRQSSSRWWCLGRDEDVMAVVNASKAVLGTAAAILVRVQSSVPGSLTYSMCVCETDRGTV